MKRSEAINTIVNNLVSDPRVSKLQNAENILIALEKAGMLPPSIVYLATNESVNIKDTDILYDNDAEFSWEQE